MFVHYNVFLTTRRLHHYCKTSTMSWKHFSIFILWRNCFFFSHVQSVRDLQVVLFMSKIFPWKDFIVYWTIFMLEKLFAFPSLIDIFWTSLRWRGLSNFSYISITTRRLHHTRKSNLLLIKILLKIEILYIFIEHWIQILNMVLNYNFHKERDRSYIVGRLNGGRGGVFIIRSNVK